VVVDRDVDVLPTGTRAARDPVVQDALPDMPEAAQFLGVDVQQLAGPLPFIAHHRGPRLTGQPRAAQPPEHLADRGRRAPDDRPDHLRSASRASPDGEDFSLRLTRELARVRVWSRRTVA
jgi:hypothetical protein